MVATAGKKLRRVKKATPPDVYRMRSSRMPLQHAPENVAPP
jgi:hypothetical protein